MTMQTVSLGVGFKELKGRGFFSPSQNELKCRLIHSCWAMPVIMVKLTENGVLCVFLTVVYRYVLPMLLFCFSFLPRSSHLAFTVLLFLPSLDKLDSMEMLTSTKVMHLDFVLLQNAVKIRQEK